MMTYADRRDMLIPEAEKICKASFGFTRPTVVKVGAGGLPFKYCLWTELFHKTMDRLAKEAGLC